MKRCHFFHSPLFVIHVGMPEQGKPCSWDIRLVFQNKAVSIRFLCLDGACSIEFSWLVNVGQM